MKRLLSRPVLLRHLHRDVFHDLAEIITALAALGALIQSWRNAGKISDVHVSINSRMDQLLKATGIASKAEGVAQGRKDQQAENGER